MIKSGPNGGGFTLLEVLVALVIVAVGVSAVAKMISQSVSIRDETEKRFAANLVSSNYLNRILLSDQWQNASGGIEKSGGNEWNITVTQTATANPDILRIDVSSHDGAGLAGDVANGYGHFFYYKARLNRRNNDD